MTTILITLAASFISAFIPVLNAEAYLAGVAIAYPAVPATALALAGAGGQMAGKYLWYLGAANAMKWSWLRTHMEAPKRKAAYGKWRERVEDRPVLAGAILFLSAFIGVPPLAITPILAGHLRMNVWLFLLVGLVGRWLRFELIIAGVSLLPW